jgi:excisionase family DNA binding protein
MKRLVGVRAERKRGDSSREMPHGARATRPANRPGDRPAPQGVDQESALWDVTDVSAYLQIPISSLYKMTGRRAAVRIPHIRIGGKLRFRQADVDRWLTLLTVSNVKILEKTQQQEPQEIYGHDPQAETQKR